MEVPRPLRYLAKVLGGKDEIGLAYRELDVGGGDNDRRALNLRLGISAIFSRIHSPSATTILEILHGSPKQMKQVDSNPSLTASIQEWLETRPKLMPLAASNDSPEHRSLAALIEEYPCLNGNLLEAMLCLRIGAIDRAHVLVQNGSTSMESYLHGVIHRLEGDFWNAKYWFRQINKSGLLSTIGATVADSLRSRGLFDETKSLKIIDRNEHFDPMAFVDKCEAIKSSTKDGELLQQIGQTEWETLWQYHRSIAVV